MLPHHLLVTLSWGMLSFLPAQLLPVYGGSGGTAFTRGCGAGKVLTGVRYRAGLFVDAVGLLCRPVNANGTLGSETTVGTLAGGGGGTSGAVSCPSGKVVAGLSLRYGSYIEGLSLDCRAWTSASKSFGGPVQYTTPFGNWNGSLGTRVGEKCEAPTQPGVSVRGRSASFVDAIGLICDEP